MELPAKGRAEGTVVRVGYAVELEDDTRVHALPSMRQPLRRETRWLPRSYAAAASCWTDAMSVFCSGRDGSMSRSLASGRS